MIVKLTADRRVVLEAVDNFRAFKLVVEGRRQDLDACAPPCATSAELVDADTAWVSRERRCRRPAARSRTDIAWRTVVRRHDREGAPARLD